MSDKVVDFKAAQRTANALVDEVLQQQTRRIEQLVAERERIAAILKTLYESPVSISSLQPILDLACALNPGLRDFRRDVAEAAAVMTPR